MKYEIQVKNIDLSLEDSLTKLNSVFHELCYGYSESVVKDSFIEDDYQQTLKH